MNLMLSTAAPVHIFTGGTATRKLLDVEVPMQEQDNWCWCAVTLGLRHFYGLSATSAQCEVAKDVLNVPTACQAPGGSTSNVMHDLADALRHYGLLADTPVEGDLSFDAIVRHIDANRPIGAQTLFLNTGLGHVLVIRGYRKEGGTERILIDDPRFGEVDIPLAQFTRHYKDWGEWVVTYPTRPPGA